MPTDTLWLTLSALANPGPPAASVPPEIQACRDRGLLWLSDPDSYEPTEIETDDGIVPVWQVRDRQGGRIGHVLVYPGSCRIVVLIVTPSTEGAPVTQVVPPEGTPATSPEVRMLRKWAGVVAPVPAPCAQRWDNDGDGTIDHETRYRYDSETGGLLAVISDDHEVTFTLDEHGRPLSMSTGTDCTKQWSSAAFTPQCPQSMTCTRNELGLIEHMQRGPMTVTNDYSCWTRGPERWTFTEPSTGD